VCYGWRSPARAVTWAQDAERLGLSVDALDHRRTTILAKLAQRAAPAGVEEHGGETAIMVVVS